MDEQDKNSQTNKFLEDLGIKSDATMNPEPFKGPDSQESEPESKEDVVEEDKLKNRREKRLMAKVQAEREANIALNARLNALSEAQKLRSETTEADFLKLVDPIFGTADEKGQYDPRRVEATRLLKDALKGVYSAARKEAVEEALTKVNEERTSETNAVKAEEDRLDEIMDDVEETYGIDFSSKKDREGFLNLLESASPKDEDGDIIEFADPDTVAKLYLAQRDKTSSRAKELAARSGQRSGSSQSSELPDQAFYNGLKELGLMD